MNPAEASSTYDAPPSYGESVSSPQPNPPQEKAISGSNLLPEPSTSDAEDDIPTTSPPPFFLSPITLVIPPRSTLIEPTINNTRALYELTRPLNGHSRTLALAEILATSQLREDGHCIQLKDRQILYKIYEMMEYPRNPNHTAISAQSRKPPQGTILKRHCKLGGSNFWEASSHGEDWIDKPGLLQYSGKQKKGGLEWKDKEGTLVAVESMAVNRESEEERLEILVQMGKMEIDLLVATWVARIHQDTQKEGEKEEKVEKRKRKEEQRERDVEEGRPHGVLHDMKEALGIGYGVKPGPTGGGPMFTGPPTITDEGRIKWP